MSGLHANVFGRLKLIPAKLRSHGFSWFVNRSLRAVLSAPVYGALRNSRISRALLFFSASWSSKNTLYLFYDLRQMLISFDIAWFLVCADLHRRSCGLSGMHCTLDPVPKGAARGYPPGCRESVDATSRAWWLDNVCLSMMTLLPSLRGYTVAGSHALVGGTEVLAARSWPSRNLPSFSLNSVFRESTAANLAAADSDWGLRAPEQGLRYIRNWLQLHAKERRPVVVTMRACQFDPERNSSAGDWLAFLNGLDQNLYFPVIIPDTDVAFGFDQQAVGNVTIFNDAAWNVGLRMALYESAFLNLLVDSGPAVLCILSTRCRYVLFKVAVPGGYLTSDSALRWMRVKLGETPVFATSLQKWVWENGKSEILRREFDLMVTAIERSASERRN